MPDLTPPVLGFDEAWRLAIQVDGWLTKDQARALYDAARAVRPGRVVEIGSHVGRSTIMLAASGAPITAIDPFPVDWRYGRTDTEQRLRTNLVDSGVDALVDIHVATSRATRADWSKPVRLVFIDGKHDMWSCRDDMRWSAFLATGDVMLVHDAFSSLGVTLALMRDALTASRHRYVGRTGSLAHFVIARPSLRDRLRVVLETPWFVRNLGIKALLRLRLRPVARLLGHSDAADPY